jgi:hypothetical protein
MLDIASGERMYASRSLRLEDLAGPCLEIDFELPGPVTGLEVRLFSEKPVDLELIELRISPAI